MNSVFLIGRLTRDPDVRYSSADQNAIVAFTLAIDRPVQQNGQKQTDFPRVKAFGKLAETCEKYLHKGRQVAVQGWIETGSYQNRNGETVYTTEVRATKVEFLESASRVNGSIESAPYTQQRMKMPESKPEPDPTDGFAALDDAVPF